MKRPGGVSRAGLWRCALPAAALLAAGAATAAAAEGGHQAGVSIATLVFSAINLLLFIWVLARYVMPAVRGWVRERRAQVLDALNAAAAAKAEAERLRHEAEERLAQVEHTAAALRRQAEEDGARERERILAAARQAAEAIRRNAERSAAQEVRRAQEQLRAELARRSLALAEETVRRHWSAADQERFVADFLAQVRA